MLRADRGKRWLGATATLLFAAMPMRGAPPGAGPP